MSEQAYAVTADEPTCEDCGCQMMWSDCPNCGGEGAVNEYDTDPLWYGCEEDAWEVCDMCQGHGGHFYCPICSPQAGDD